MTATVDPALPPSSDGSPAPVEVELKYRVVDPDVGQVLLEAPTLGPFEADPHVETIQSFDRFFDTEDRAFAAVRHAVRVRTSDRGRFLTVKGPSEPGPGGSVRREELETPIDSDDPESWPATPARQRVEEIAAGRPLHETVRISQRRRRRLLRRDSSVVELTVDDVEVLDVDRPVTGWQEVEAEVVSGDPESLSDLASALVAGGGLEPSPESKLAAALRALASRQRATEADADTARRAVADLTLGELARSILVAQLDRLVAQEPATRDGDDEALHKMRVATRRMRAAWRVLGDALPEARGVQRDVRDLARGLGAVRDLDVLSAYLGRYAATRTGSDAGGVEPLAEEWARQRERARERLLDLLDSAAYTRLPDRLHDALDARGHRRSGTGVAVRRVRDTAASRVWAAHESVRAYEPVLRWADVPTLHELRIDDKRLRYTLEFFRDALGPEVAPLIARTVALQDRIGELHDADVAAGLARAFLIEHAHALPAADTAAIGRFVAEAERDVRRGRAAVPRTWRGVAGLTFRRALARLLARV